MLTIEKLAAKIIEVNTGYVSACWEWQGTIKDSGYGSFCYRDGGRDKRVYAHRIAYSLFNGPIPEGMHIDHMCQNTKCVNPQHLQAVLPEVNSQLVHLRKNGHVYSRKAGYFSSAIMQAH